MLPILLDLDINGLDIIVVVTLNEVNLRLTRRAKVVEAGSILCCAEPSGLAHILSQRDTVLFEVLCLVSVVQSTAG
jgi:hypothetical protein